MANLPNIKYTARDFQDIKNALSEYVTTTRPELWNDFFESNLGVTLLELVAYVGDILSFAVDRVGEEAFPITARRYTSMLKHAKYIGYKPSAQVNASVDVAAVLPLPTRLTTEAMTIPKGTNIKVGDIPFETLEDYVFPAGTTSVSFTMAQGESHTDTSLSKSPPTAFQKFTTSVGSVIEGSWKVYVNDVLWDEVEQLLLYTNTAIYESEFDGESKLVVTFGDGVNGLIPPSNSNIRIEYRTGVGERGNISAGSINSNVSATIGTSLYQLSITNPLSAAGGEDRETLDHIRRNIPLYIRTVDKAITKEDYDTLATNFTDTAFGNISKATAKLREGTLLVFEGTPPVSPVTVPADTAVTIAGQSYSTLVDFKIDNSNMGLFVDPNTVDIYVWTFNGTTYVPASSELKESLLNYLNARSVVTVLTIIKDGLNKPVNINLGNITVDKRFTLSVVEAAIDTVINEYFLDPARQPGDSFILSDFYNKIEDVPGVDHFVIQTPTTDVSCEDTEMIVKGTITKNLVYAVSSTPSFQGRY